MEVDDDDRRLRVSFVDELVDHLPWRLRRVEEERAEQVDDGDLYAVARLDDREPAPGRQRALVRRADYDLALREVVADAVAPERVIAERHDVRSRAEQPVGELARDSGAVGDVLAVDDADVGTELVAKTGQALLDGAAPRDSEDVREKEKSQLRTSTAAVRSSIDTWLPASFV
jgi:hypothetical protein